MMHYGVALMAVFVPGLLAESPGVMNVCDVLANLQGVRNRVIAVRGQLVGTDEGSYLIGNRCQESLVTNGYQWPNPIPIFLIPPDSGLVEKPDSPRPKVVADRGLDAALARVEMTPGLKIWVTYIGKLETRERFEIVLRGDGKKVPYGFGHMNSCPAQLVYRVLKDIVVK